MIGAEKPSNYIPITCLQLELGYTFETKRLKKDTVKYNLKYIPEMTLK